MEACRRCGASIERSFRFCPWCAAPLRRKLVEFFEAHPEIEQDRRKALRVSRYLDEGHVRFSVWDETGTATCAVSLEESEAFRLRAFLAWPEPSGSLSRRRRRRSSVRRV